MITLTPGATWASDDPTVAPDPNPRAFGGVDVRCPTGALSLEVALPAATSHAQIPFPPGVTTAGFLGLWASQVADLVVTYKGQNMGIPAGQPAFFYGVGPTDVTVSTAGGGTLAAVVGG